MTPEDTNMTDDTFYFIEQQKRLDDQAIQKEVLENSFRTLDAVAYLTDHEVSTVTFVHSNPDFCGPAEIVHCNGYWTDYKETSFGGETRLEALEKAVAAKRAATATEEHK